MRPIDEWDEQYVLSEIANAPESASFERKASLAFGSTGPAKAEIAQEICAFANSGEGFIVYGVKEPKDGGGIDGGIAGTIGRQAVDSWVSALIPKLHHPPIVNCVSRFIPMQNMGGGNGVLVVFVPLSDRRPHWSTQGAPPEIPYLRVGEHSAPMRLQTLLDISGRGSAPFGEIGANPGFDEFQDAQFLGRWIRPTFRVAGGPVCQTWGLEIQLKGVAADALDKAHQDSAEIHRDSEENVSTYFTVGNTPLFPGRWTAARPVKLLLSRPTDLQWGIGQVPKRRLRISLFLESAIPVHSEWEISWAPDDQGFEFVHRIHNRTASID
jgi:hypothetical protein